MVELAANNGAKPLTLEYVCTLHLLLSIITYITHVREKMSHPLRLCITTFVYRKVMEEFFYVKQTCTLRTYVGVEIIHLLITYVRICLNSLVAGCGIKVLVEERLHHVDCYTSSNMGVIFLNQEAVLTFHDNVQMKKTFDKLSKVGGKLYSNSESMNFRLLRWLS